MLLKVHSLIQQKNLEWDRPQTLAEFIGAYAQDPTCHQYTVSVGQSVSKLYIDSNVLFAREITTEGAVQPVLLNFFKDLFCTSPIMQFWCDISDNAVSKTQ